MSRPGITEQAVIHGPKTIAPPSFAGHDWLVVVNLTVFTAGFCLLAMLVGWLMQQMWRNRHGDGWLDPVTIHRRIGLAWATGFALRCLGEAYSIWAWDPLDPAATALALHTKRFLDPVAAGIGFYGLALYALSLRGMIPQLRKQPFPLNMWASMPMLKRPAIIVLLTLAAAIGVTATR